MKHLFESFNKQKIMIIGDIMIDVYMRGKVDRISPEAPVPIVSVTERFSRLGGAANVAQNLKTLGAKPLLCSICGKDDSAKEIINLMTEQGMDISGIVESDNRITTSKVRIIGNNSQMLRVDTEDTYDLNDKEYNLLIDRVTDIINKEEINGIILQDYNKGVLTENVIKKVIEMANKKNIPVGVDPKKKNFLEYQNVTLFKPNLKELKEGIGMSSKEDNIESIINAIDTLQEKLNCRYIMTTLSEKGVIIKDFNNNIFHHIPAHIRKIADVSGAGDTVLSVAMLCLVCNQDAYHIAALSNLAGGLVCEEIGAAPVNKEKLFAESNKIIN